MKRLIVSYCFRLFIIVIAAAAMAWFPVPRQCVAADSDKIQKPDIMFKKGSMHAGGGLGGGPGLEVLGSLEAHDMVIGYIGAGKIITETQAPDRWFAGNLEIRGELFGGFQYHPKTDYFAGLTPFLRYNLVRLERFVPFVEGGAGISWTDIEGPDLMGKFQFNLQGGIGFHYIFNQDTTFIFQSRFFHFSNGGLRESNHGLNAVHILVSISKFF